MPSVLSKSQIDELVRNGRIVDERGKVVVGQTKPASPKAVDASVAIVASMERLAGGLADSNKVAAAQLKELVGAVRDLARERGEGPGAWVLRVTERDSLGRIVSMKATKE